MITDDRLASATQKFDAEILRLNAQIERLLIPPVRAPKVLLVDDSPFIEQVAENLAYRLPAGTEVSYSLDADDAVSRIKNEGPWDVAVLDLHLGHPDITGLDLLAMLPRTTRIILVTGVTPDRLPYISKATRVDAYFVKPFTPDDIAKKVMELLKAREQ